MYSSFLLCSFCAFTFDFCFALFGSFWSFSSLSVEPDNWGEWTGASLLSLFAISYLWSFLSRSWVFSSLVLSLLPCSVAGLNLCIFFQGGRERQFSPFVALCFFLILSYASSFFCLLCYLCFLQVLFTVLFLLLSFSFLPLRGVWSTPCGLPCEDSSAGSMLLESSREELCYFFSFLLLEAFVCCDGGSPGTEVSEGPLPFLSYVLSRPVFCGEQFWFCFFVLE